jgi:hypothetical protein
MSMHHLVPLFVDGCIDSDPTKTLILNETKFLGIIRNLKIELEDKHVSDVFRGIHEYILLDTTSKRFFKLTGHLEDAAPPVTAAPAGEDPEGNSDDNDGYVAPPYPVPISVVQPPVVGLVKEGSGLQLSISTTNVSEKEDFVTSEIKRHEFLMSMILICMHPALDVVEGRYID